MIVPVILSGGVGTRLWPLSRAAYPKQFVPLLDDSSLFQATLKRIAGLDGCGNPLVVCNEEHRFLVAEQLRLQGVESNGILLEPVGKNTAPAVACAALHARQSDEDALLLVMPSDHVIGNLEAFQQCIRIGAREAAAGALVTFGVVAEQPETGYGYIRRADEGRDGEAYPVAEFVEKPDLETAKRYVESGRYYWNSGMFMFRAESYLQELEQWHPRILEQSAGAYAAGVRDLDFLRLGAEAFSNCPGESIDYAVMEKTEKAVVVPMDARWSDVGSWSSLADVTGPDQDGNVLLGDVVADSVTNCYLRGENRLIAGVGINNLVVVESADAVLVADKSKAQDIKKIVDILKASGRNEHLHHVRVYRPWGNYESLDSSERFQVKRIVVKPGGSLSLQLHQHRAEHWVVVKGTATIVRGEEELVLHEDQSVYIPMGTKHRLFNSGLIPLEIIEVQTGSYLGEDDIVRFEDIYGR